MPLQHSTVRRGKDNMGVFRVNCRVENIENRKKAVNVDDILVDTGSEYTWITGSLLTKIGIKREKKDLQFVMANGSMITRNVGFAILRVDDSFTVDEVVFAEEGDLLLLGARTLEGMNLTVDASRKKLVAAGPLPAAASGKD
jgi:predicted aspartyl protease